MPFQSQVSNSNELLTFLPHHDIDSEDERIQPQRSGQHASDSSRADRGASLSLPFLPHTHTLRQDLRGLMMTMPARISYFKRTTGKIGP